MLFTEKSMFQSQKKRRRRKKDSQEESGVEPVGGSDDEEDNDESGEEDDDENDEFELEYKKKVEEALREWIETEECRRDVADRYYDNPPDRARM